MTTSANGNLVSKTEHRQRPNRLTPLLLFAGGVEVALGLIHFVMPSLYRESEGIANLSANEAAFVDLVTYAVGILLVAFGLVTLSFARHPAKHLDVLIPYLVIKCVLWSARLVLELVLPVQLKMFLVDPFTTVVLPGLVVELGVFVAATHQAHKTSAMIKSIN